MERKILEGFVWFIGGYDGSESYGEFQPMTEDKMRELLKVREIYEIEEMFTNSELDTEWVNIEGLDYGYKWLYCEEDDIKGIMRELTIYLRDILGTLKGKEVSYIESTNKEGKVLVITGLEDTEREELVHYKIMYR